MPDAGWEDDDVLTGQRADLENYYLNEDPMLKENQMTKRFDEDALRADIVKTWGKHGAHVELFDEIVRRAHEDKQRAIVPMKDGMFTHQCISPGCGTLVEYDDEPCCFKHSPDSGSHLPFYSARERLTQGVTPP
jgi:hypothetical protein